MIVLQSLAANIVPRRQLVIARHFSAGFIGHRNMSPSGTADSMFTRLPRSLWRSSACHAVACEGGWLNSFSDFVINHPGSTLPHPKSTVELGCGPLNWGDHALKTLPIAYSGRPKNLGIQGILITFRNQTKIQPNQAGKLFPSKVDLGCLKSSSSSCSTPTVFPRLFKPIQTYPRLPKAIQASNFSSHGHHLRCSRRHFFPHNIACYRQIPPNTAPSPPRPYFLRSAYATLQRSNALPFNAGSRLKFASPFPKIRYFSGE
jgi:hypothetical protein